MIGPCQRCGEERTLRKGVLCHSCAQTFLCAKMKLAVRHGMSRAGRRSHGGTHKAPPVSLATVEALP